GLPTRPDFVAGQPETTALSPDGRTLLVLTTGYNRNAGPDGQRIADESNEYVFAFDVTGGSPALRQVLQIPNTFHALTWRPPRNEFYVTGGVNDNLRAYGWDRP